MTDYCRLCAELKDFDEIVASISDVDQLIEQKLRACCQWTDENIGHRLPHSVCSICFDKLEKCWLFSKGVQSAQQRLLEIFEHETDVKAEVALELTQTDVDFTEFIENELPQAIAMDLPAAAPATSLFQCHICHVSFESHRSLRAHCKFQSQNRCPQCSREFCSASELISHQIADCKRPIEEDCNESQYQIDVNAESQDEADQQSDDETRCKLCEKSYSNKSNLRYHLRTNHSIRDIYNCKKCGKHFAFKKQLRAHRDNDSGLCKPNEDVSNAISEETLSILKEHRRIFQCEDCGSSFTFKSNLRTHQRIAHSDRLPYTCEECGKGFSFKKEIRLHHVSTHLALIKCLYECWLCHETFQEVDLLKDHMRVHTPEMSGKVLNLLCRICQKSFKAHRSYRAHCKYQKLNKCDSCSQVFCTVADLNTHRQQECGQSLERGTTTAANPQHQYASDGEMVGKLKCHICGKKYSTPEGLRYHHRVVHSRFTYDAQSSAHRSTPADSGQNYAYECWLCHDTFYVRRLLWIHMQTHINGAHADGKPSYECRICHSTFASHRALRAHCKDQMQNKCENCSKEFCTALDLAAHRYQQCDGQQQQQQQQHQIDNDGEMHGRSATTAKKQSNRPLSQCNICLKFFTFKSNLTLHLRTVHDLRDLYKCDECGKHFEYRRQLTLHRATHVIVNAAERYPCPLCDRTFSSLQQLRSHQSNMHSGEFQCNFCDMTFSTKSDFFEHRNVHTDQMHKCEHCDRTFWKKSNLYSHQRSAHLNIRRFKCNECGKRYPYRSHLRKHMKSHHPELVVEEKYECWCCHKTFLGAYLLKRHIKLRHMAEMEVNRPDPSEKRFICELCGKHLSQMAGLKRHMKHLHSNERPLKCQHCGLGFKTRHALMSHLTVHADFQFKCSQCDKMFRKKDFLRRHMAFHMETKVKPHACDFCEKSFRRIPELREHRRIHTGERPYTCEHCSSNFRTASSYYAHLRKTHGISKLALNLEKRFQEAGLSYNTNQN